MSALNQSYIEREIDSSFPSELRITREEWYVLISKVLDLTQEAYKEGYKDAMHGKPNIFDE